ncbi:unnamed protein product [Adineta ricciae]|uniref:C2H2-type domain-containing protein n=1 Tax=Adineta ricciae TaxID=249248 RepID=A0A815RXR6_ADIRI|nr:unnamed protein product [Adineta ricciae]CAF1482683.1 unnamed protein product [Adineta ricciae]
MENDSQCLFADVSGCTGTTTSCRYLCETPSTTEDSSYLYGAQTRIESLLLYYGKFDTTPHNIEKYHVCNGHLLSIQPSLFKNCCLCKPLGRSKCSKSGLRTISKLYAFAAWKKNAIRRSFGRKMCTQCRNNLEKYFSNDDIKRECDEVFQWLYDPGLTHTSSAASSDYQDRLSESFHQLMAEQKQDCLKNLLDEIAFQGTLLTTASFVSLQSSSKTRFIRKATKVLKSILGIMAPNDNVDDVWNAGIENFKFPINQSLDKNSHLILTSFAEAYNNACHWTVRQQILSIIARDVSLQTLLVYIPGVTKYRFIRARKHCLGEGKGVVVDITRNPTVRYDDYQLSHFIEFIVSPHICSDLPFGEKQLKLATGEVLIIPMTIRNLAPKRIIDQYYKYCEEYYGNSFRPLGESTLFSILHECTASTRRSLQGLDSYSAEGSTAFDCLISIVEELSALGLPAHHVASLKKDLQESRNYLKSDYKVHVSCSNQVADHCTTYALSSTDNKCWNQTCDHHHDQQCDRCELLKISLAKIEMFIEQYQMDSSLRDRLLHRLKQQTQYILEWKAHLLRTIHQDQPRVNILENLDHETAIIHVDWAMKWLPTKYRESTKDHFAKRGLSWHLAYVIRNNSQVSASSLDESFNSQPSIHSQNPDNNKYEHKVFCHVFDQCVQNGKTVVSIIRHICLRLQQSSPNIKFIHLRSDNAGCYHGGEALLSPVQLFKETGVWIKSIDFSDPQSGKGPCDRLAAVIKCFIRRFINEKNDCTNAIEFIKAAENTKGVEYYVCELEHVHTDKIKWNGVKQINNIEYIQGEREQSVEASTKVRMWQSWKIGPGKVYRWEDFENVVVKICPLKIIASKNVAISWVEDSSEKGVNDINHGSDSSSDDTETNEDETDDLSDTNQTSDNELFGCPVDGCVASYRYYTHLLRHCTIGKHQMKLEKYSLIDKSKMLFHQKLTTNTPHTTPLLSITVIPFVNNAMIPQLTEGWALQKNKPTIRFNEKQRQFLQEKFNQGVETGMKWDPAKVALEMETSTSNGNYIFTNDECLTQGQIKSYFSRLAAKRRTAHPSPDGNTNSSVKSSPSTFTSTIENNNTQSESLADVDESSDDDEVDNERDLEIYSWRNILDEARGIIDRTLNSAATASPSTTPTTKRKSIVDISKQNKHKHK